MRPARQIDSGLRERFVDGKLGGVIPVVGDEGSECALVAESEDAGLESTGAFETPMVFGDGLGEFDLQGAYGLEGFADAGAVLVEGFVLVGSEEIDLAGETVTIGVEAGAVLAILGSGAGGFLSVGEVGFELCAGCHVFNPRN